MITTEAEQTLLVLRHQSSAHEGRPMGSGVVQPGKATVLEVTVEIVI